LWLRGASSFEVQGATVSALIFWSDCREPHRSAAYLQLLTEGKITEEVVHVMRSWKHSGFSVDQSVRLEAGDQEGLQRLIQYFLRCPFSQARMIEVTEAGQVTFQGPIPARFTLNSPLR
jgi:hypothetical protein